MKLFATLTLSHAVMRTEVNGDEPRRPGLTLKWKGNGLNEEVARDLFTTYASYQSILAPRWNDQGELTSSDITEVPLAVEIHGGIAVLETFAHEKVHFNERVKVDKVVITPLAGRKCDFECSMAVYPEEAEDLWFVYHQQGKQLTVTCTPSQLSLEGSDTTGPQPAPEPKDREDPQSGDLELDPPAGSEQEETDRAFAGLEVE